ncbi:MAG: porin [Gemmatimonadaceae bacterium]|nr:porin [Gemmatimonadaceae bacterium]
MTGHSRPARCRRFLAAAGLLSLAAAPVSGAQDSVPRTAPPPARPWYEKISVRGYGQVRYNRLLETNPQLACEQCDRSWGDLGGVFIRRARIIFSGQVHRRVFVYLQPDFASSAGTTNHLGQLRDWYADVGLDARNEFRVRIGQSKVPFGYENMQSSQNRLPLDRADATNSASANERDLGAFVYWAPARVRERLRTLVSEGLKGSGDYGVLALGVFNGQTANRAEANNGQHVVARVAYPLRAGHQVIEPAVAAYTGRYVVTADQRSTGVKGRRDWNYRDERMVASLSIAPQPFGVLAEWNAGRGPEFNPATDSIETRRLRGGFVTATYRVRSGTQLFFPFVRYQVYDGGKKQERDARSYRVRDVEAGVEWQPSPAFELTAEMYWGDRRFEDFQRQANTQRGRLLRLQAQFNY